MSGPAPDATTLLVHETKKLNLLRATLALCTRHERIAELTRVLDALPRCAVEGALTYCTDRMESSGSIDEPPCGIPWWEMNAEQLATLCIPCRSRVDLWRERARLKAGGGGLKRALLLAYRAYVAAEAGR